MEYFTFSNLPNICSNRVIIDCRVQEETIRSIKSLGIEPIFSYKSAYLLEPISSHPDMTILHLGKNRFICSPDSYDYYKDKLPNADIVCGSQKLSKDYPNDIFYNITILGNYIFARSNQIEFIKTNIPTNREILKVNQGYTKCNICIVNQNAIITSDKGIYNTAIKKNIDVLLIDAGHIELKGLNYGFIGGATGLLAADMLAVNGDIKSHPDGNNIIDFCKNYGVDVISLKKGVICDIGSILPIF